MANKELVDILNSTDIYDAYYPIIKSKIKESGTWNKIMRIFQEFMQKNESKLTTNIVGRQVLINQKMETDILDALGIDKNEFRNVMNNSTYFKEQFGRELQLTDQLCLGIPLILASLEYKRLNKHEESELCYLLAHFKPYASRESLFFKYGVKENQMLYCVEKHMSERFDIKRIGTIIGVIQKKADSSYANYIDPIGKTDKVTDNRLYVIYSSGIATYINAFLNGVAQEYKKCEGKSLNYSDTMVGLSDKDTDEVEFFDAEIASDAAIKTKIVNAALIRISKDPIDTKILTMAVQSVFKSSNKQTIGIVRSIITEVTDKMYDDLEPFFSALIGSFLFRDKGNGDRYTMEDFKTPVFLNVGIDILAGKKSNLKDENMITARKILQKMFDECGSEYNKMGFGTTYERMYKQAIAAYWVFLLKGIH